MKLIPHIAVFLALIQLSAASGFPVIDVDLESVEKMGELNLEELKKEMEKEDFLYAGTKNNWHIVVRNDSFLDKDIAGIYHEFTPFKISTKDCKILGERDLSDCDLVIGFMCDLIAEIDIKTKTINANKAVERNAEIAPLTQHPSH